jgi:hypothetical protein
LQGDWTGKMRIHRAFAAVKACAAEDISTERVFFACSQFIHYISRQRDNGIGPDRRNSDFSRKGTS